MASPLVTLLMRRNLANVTCRPYFSVVGCFHTQTPNRKENALVNSIISNASTGKIKGGEIQKLISEVVRESQFRKITESPAPALGLGLAGLVPFAAVPLLTIANGTILDGLMFAQLAYGATILAFLGGANWGEAIAQNQPTKCRLGWAVTPQLLGWVALALPVPAGLLVTSAGLAAAVTHDVLLTENPQWHKALRFVLTAGAISSLTASLFLYVIY